MGTGQLTGLSQAEAENRLREFGLNQFSKPSRISFLKIAREEITEPLILLLLVVGIFYSIWGNIEDALTIFGIIITLALVEIWNEYRAKKAISALSEIAAPKTKVLREGKIVEIETDTVVPGDIQILSSGTRVAADSKLLVSFNVQVDESSLTGEAAPQDKSVNDEVYAETLVVYGEGEAQVLATGKNTKFGKISALAQEIKEPKTPLQLAMKVLSKNLVWIALFFSILIPVIGLLRGQDFRQMVLTGLALSFATIPEEGPIIITLILGLGAYQLSKQNFLVKKTRAAEVLGNATVILTDKTGTITESQMKVVTVYPTGQESDILAKATAALTRMSLSPTDKGILQKADELKACQDAGELVRERPFGDGQKTKSVLRRTNNGLELTLLGAPEDILSLINGDKRTIQEELNKETARGRRVIGVAGKTVSVLDKDLAFPDLEKDLSFIGLISLEDPPRKGVKETIKRAQQAGIRTIMVTGDHPQTAAFIAANVGIPSEKVLTGDELDKISDQALQETIKGVSIFARTTPEHKYRLVKALQANNEIVAVTGDGVNDTLALKGANIGIAMGIKGTDTAKEAADVVLADDNYVTIARGIFEGRKFFDNLRKGFRYYLSAKTALILAFLLPVVLNVPFPFAPVQIIVLELFMDLAASAAFVAEPAEKTIYRRPPRDPKKNLFNGQMVREILVSGFNLFAAVSLSYFYALWQNLPLAEARTFAFSAWIIGHVVLAFVSRSDDEPLYSLGPFTNKVMNIWALAAVAFLFIAVEVPVVNYQLRLASISLMQLGGIAIISFVAIFWKEIVKAASFKKAKPVASVL